MRIHVVRDEPGTFRLEQGANQFFNINGSEDGPRATRTHGGVVSQNNKDRRKHRETSWKLQEQALAAQKQYSTRRYRMNC
jgi:hypothetical protein